MPGVDLRTDRLLLRQWRYEEADRLFDMLRRDEIARWLGTPVALVDPAQAVEKVGTYLAMGQTPPYGAWAVEVAPGQPRAGTVVGTVMLMRREGRDEGEAEVGWYLHPDSWGQGYAGEAASALVAHAASAGLCRVVALTDVDNAASVRVALAAGLVETDRDHSEPARPSRVFVAHLQPPAGP